MSEGAQLVEVADRTWAHVHPEGGWGFSNAGLVVGDGTSLLVDTLFDLRLTEAMLAEMRRVTPAADHISTVVNTHANGDHTYGNQLVPGAEIIASRATAAEFDATPPAVMEGFLAAAPDLGALGDFVTAAFGAFDFAGITLVPPTRTFDGALTLQLGDRRVELIELGPAHTAGDVVAWLPDDGVVFTGDLLFHGGHPIVWAGPVQGWIDACAQIVALDPSVVVPGHGALAEPAAVEAMGAHLQWVLDECRIRVDAGLDVAEATSDLHAALPSSPWAGWRDSERIAVNVTAAYRDLGQPVDDDVVSLFTAMAALADG